MCRFFNMTFGLLRPLAREERSRATWRVVKQCSHRHSCDARCVSQTVAPVEDDCARASGVACLGREALRVPLRSCLRGRSAVCTVALLHCSVGWRRDAAAGSQRPGLRTSRWFPP